MKKVVLITILIAELAFVYWQHAVEKAEYLANHEFNYHFGRVAEFQVKLLNPETADLSDLADLNYHLEELGLSPINIGLNEKRLKEIERNCHKNEAKSIFSYLAKQGFNLDTYNRMRSEATQANIRVADLFSTEEMRINTIQRGQEVLYHTGWRKATTQESAEFQAIEDKEQKQREEELRQCLKDYPPRYYLVSDRQRIEMKPLTQRDPSARVVSINTETGTMSAQLPTGSSRFNVLTETQCNLSSSGLYSETRVYINGTPMATELDVQRGWLHTDDGYEVPTFVDIAPVLATDGLMVVDNFYLVGKNVRTKNHKDGNLIFIINPDGTIKRTTDL